MVEGTAALPLAINMSKAIFRSAPGVMLAGNADKAGLTRAGARPRSTSACRCC